MKYLFYLLILLLLSCSKQQPPIPHQGIPQGKFVIRFTKEVIEDSITVDDVFRPHFIKGDTIYFGYYY